MASWVTHLRVAEGLKELFKGHEYAFFTGNLATDGGKINSDATYTPPAYITHWYTTPDVFSINPDAFAAEYIYGKVLTEEETAFLWGYYCHLYTDVLYNELLAVVYEKQNLEKCMQTRMNVYGTATDIDYLYLNQNPNGTVINFINNFTGFENTCIEYFEKDGLTKRIIQMCGFYKDLLNRTYKPSGISYFTTDDIKMLVNKAVIYLDKKIGITIG